MFGITLIKKIGKQTQNNPTTSSKTKKNIIVAHIFFLFHVINEMSYLLFAESLKKCYIDVVNGDAENHNNHILDHSFGESISIVYNHSLIGIRSAHLLEAEKHVFKYIMLMTQNKSFTWDLMNLLRLIILSFLNQ